MKLYELPEKMAELMDRYIDPETGELMDEEQFDKEIAKLEMQADEVYEYIALQIKNELAEADAIKKEIEILQKRIKSKQNAAERKKDYMSQYFKRDKLETPRVKITWSKSTHLEIPESLSPENFYYEIADEEGTEDLFVRHKEIFEWNKSEITRMIKGNDSRINGEFKLVEKKNLQIK